LRRVNELEHTNLKDFGRKMFSILVSTHISNFPSNEEEHIHITVSMTDEYPNETRRIANSTFTPIIGIFVSFEILKEFLTMTPCLLYGKRICGGA